MNTSLSPIDADAENPALRGFRRHRPKALQWGPPNAHGKKIHLLIPYICVFRSRGYAMMISTTRRNQPAEGYPEESIEQKQRKHQQQQSRRGERVKTAAGFSVLPGFAARVTTVQPSRRNKRRYTKRSFNSIINGRGTLILCQHSTQSVLFTAVVLPALSSVMATPAARSF